jgi:hypothetical protein
MTSISRRNGGSFGRDSPHRWKFPEAASLRAVTSVVIVLPPMAAIAHTWLIAIPWIAACTATPAPPHDPAEPPRTTTVPRGPATATVAAATSSASPTADTPAIERTHTGQEQPTVVVENAYPRTQHVFIDGRLAGQVASGEQATFDVTTGVHTVTCADSTDPDDNPSSATESFEGGYGYRYTVVTK